MNQGLRDDLEKRWTVQEVCSKPKRPRWSATVFSGSKTPLLWRTAAEAFGDCRRGLKIRPEWLKQILEGTKKIEIRGNNCPHLGRVLLIEVGTKLVKGSAQIVKSYRLNEIEKLEHAEALAAITAYSTPWAWELAEVHSFEASFSVPPEVAKGSVTWLTRERWEAFDAKRNCDAV